METWIDPSPKWDEQGRWARSVPPEFGSDDWKRENRRQQIELAKAYRGIRWWVMLVLGFAVWALVTS